MNSTIAAIFNALPILLPLVCAALLTPARTRDLARSAAPWLPLTLLPPAGFVGSANAPLLLLDLRLGVDAISAPILLLCAIAWTLAGWMARSRVRRDTGLFWSGWLISLAGMSLALLTGDMAGFYAGFALLSLGSWLMIVHARSDDAHRAGRVYLTLTLIGEMGVFAGVVAIASTHGNVPLDQLAATVALSDGWQWLILAGFAVKMGVVPLHVWLPLAHPVAPVPASAILSGVIVKAGLLGALRLLPPEAAGTQSLAPVLVPLGLASAFLGVLAGLCQTRIKVVLAYSTISQMGLVLAMFGALLASGGAAMPWLGVLVLHHGLNKAALFLACGCAPGRTALRRGLFALPAVALAAAPLSTGMLAKTGIKTSFAGAGLGPNWLLALSLSSAATALLMWRVWTLAREDRQCVPAHPAWVLLVLAGLVVPWLWASGLGLPPNLIDALWPATWPLILAAALIALKGQMARGLMPRIPAGDLVVPVERGLRNTLHAIHRHLHPGILRPPNLYPVHLRVIAIMLWLERRMIALPVAGLLILAIGGLFWLLAWFG